MGRMGAKSPLLGNVKGWQLCPQPFSHFCQNLVSLASEAPACHPQPNPAQLPSNLQSLLPVRCVAFRVCPQSHSLLFSAFLAAAVPFSHLVLILPSLDKTDQSCPGNQMSTDF